MKIELELNENQLRILKRLVEEEYKRSTRYRKSLIHNDQKYLEREDYLNRLNKVDKSVLDLTQLLESFSRAEQ